MKSESWWRSPDRRDFELFAIGLLIALVAKGVALLPFGYSVDSYPKLIAMSEDLEMAAGDFGEFVGQGRLGQWALTEILRALGVVGSGGQHALRVPRTLLLRSHRDPALQILASRT